MKELIEAIESRAKSPVLGYFSLAFFAFNWRSIFVLLFDSEPIRQRIEFFDSNSDVYSLLLWPVIFSAIVTIIYPWVRYLIVRLTVKPIELINSQQAMTEHKLLLRQKELEEARTQLLSEAEEELIDRAKRDMELTQIESDEIREKLQAELEQLRKLRDSEKSGSKEADQQSQVDELMRVATTYRERAKDPATNTLDTTKFLDRARELERKAHQIILRLADA